jgi:hypothetical protein
LKNVTAIVQQQDIQDKLVTLNSYINRLESVIHRMDLSKKEENLDALENHIFMIQGQQQFVREAIETMKKEFQS